MVPFDGIFDTLRFELQDKTVILSGQVLHESAKLDAERAVKRLDGVEKVANQVEVLPSSRRDDAIRMNVYRASYEKQSLRTVRYSSSSSDSHPSERWLPNT